MQSKVFIQGSRSPESRRSPMSLGAYRNAGEVFGLSQARIPKMGVGGCYQVAISRGTNLPADPQVCPAFPTLGGKRVGVYNFCSTHSEPLGPSLSPERWSYGNWQTAPECKIIENWFKYKLCRTQHAGRERKKKKAEYSKAIDWILGISISALKSYLSNISI